METAYWLGVQCALEALARHMTEAADMLDYAGLIYDEANDTLADLQACKR